MTLDRTNRRRLPGGGGMPPPPSGGGKIVAFPLRSWRILRRYWLLVGGLLLAFTLMYAVVSEFGVPLLDDPSPAIAAAGSLAAVVVFGLLLGDVVLPVPSSLVMVAAGALFGPIAGATLSLAGGVAGTAAAFALGRRGGPLLERLVGPAERSAADQLVERHGAVAILVTRPVPLLAETTALLAGASPLSWPRAIQAAALGTLPAAVAYAMVGSLAVDFPVVASVFGAVIVLAAALWLVERRLHATAR